MNGNKEFNQTEKIEANVLRITGISLILIIAKGIYNDATNIDENFLLMPSMMVCAGVFSIVYFTNAFTSGNLVRRWAMQDVFNRIFFVLKKSGKISEEKALIMTTKIFGIGALCAWPVLYFIFKLAN